MGEGVEMTCDGGIVCYSEVSGFDLDDAMLNIRPRSHLIFECAVEMMASGVVSLVRLTAVYVGGFRVKLCLFMWHCVRIFSVR